MRLERSAVRAVLLAVLVALGPLVPGCAGPRSDEVHRSRARPSSAPLESRLAALVDGFEGRVGICVRHPASGTEIAIAADEVFPTASLVKVPILLALYERIEAGELDPHQVLTYEEARSRGGEDLLAAVRDGTGVPLSKLIHLMCALSDNTASLWLQELCGGGAGVNAWLAAHGYAETRVNSRTPGREEAYRRHGWGETTPREMTRLLESIADGTAMSPRASEEMARVLAGTYWDGEACSQVPPGVQVLSKQGAVSRSRSEVLVVHAPSGRYAFCVITDGQADTSWHPENAGFVLCRDVSRLLWRHFEGDAWSPAPGVEVWR